MDQRIERVTVTIMEACSAVGCSRRTMYHWLNNGKLEFVRTAGGKVRIFEDSLWRSAAGTKLPPVTTVDRFTSRA